MTFNSETTHFGYSSNRRPRAFNLIQNYLEDTNCSAEDIAKKLTTAANELSSPELNESECSLEGFLWGLWRTVVYWIRQVPHDHGLQGRMVEVLKAIKEVPRQATPEMEELERSWGMAFWQDLPIFGAELRESWDQGPWEELPEDTPFYLEGGQFTADVWTSLNAFTARLTVASVSNFEWYAMWILRHTLEEVRIDKEVDDNLPAAAIWIKYAGQFIYHNAAKEYTDSETTHPPHIQYIRTFSKPFSKERWNFWKERFEFFRIYEVLKQTTRDSAGEALSRMAEIERRDLEPKASEGSSLPQSGMMKAVQVQGMSGDE